MASTREWQCIFAFLFILGVWVSQAMSMSTSRELQAKSITLMHEQWIAHNGRVYANSDEKENRLKIFKSNVEFIDSFNKAGNQTYKLKINEFADLTNEEFIASHTGFKKSSSASKATPFKYEILDDLPSSMDWRTEGAVTPVKNQGTCGSCWAFSVVAAIEGITKIRTGKLISLSEQEILDCNIDSGDCNFGYPDRAYTFVAKNPGIATEANYPYIGSEGTCNKAVPQAANINECGYVPRNDETALLNVVAKQPVSVCIDIHGKDFQFYSSGVFTGQCGTDLNHVVTAIGYGMSDDGIKYWLMKNSWGTQWGEEGYLRIQRDVPAMEGICGLAMSPTYPIA